jgi:Na+/proline symporter
MTYARRAAVIFVVLIALDWLAYALSSSWLDWYAVLAVAAIAPGMMIIATWDWDEF